MKRLLDIMARLRDPETGCPWDVEQTFETIAPYTLEEAYEVVDAIHARDMENLKEELGDLLLQVVFHSQMAKDGGHFTFNDVVDGICDKMIRRHPHVFGERVEKTAEQQTKDWQEMKKQEKPSTDAASTLKPLVSAFPATLQAEKLQHAADSVGFSWSDAKTAIQKIRDELDELEEVMEQGGPEAADEYGDVIFSMIRLGTMMSIPTEVALRKTNLKFIERFQKMEKLAHNDGVVDLSSLALEKWLSYWKKAKNN